MRRTASITVLVAVSVLALTGPVQAARPRAACGRGFELLTIEQILPLVADGSPSTPEELLAVLEALDRNGDELLCAKDLPDTPGSPSYVRNVVDNTASTG